MGKLLISGGFRLALLKPFHSMMSAEKTPGAGRKMAQQEAKAIALPEVIDLDALDAVRDKLIDVIEEGPVTVVASAVQRVSTNGLLMLISAAESARRNHNEFSIDAPSPAMLAAIERLGLGAQFSGMMKL
jgi:anti-anti-sigma regulatory factor